MRIAVDARFISSSTGRYVERLLHHLERIDGENEYVVLVRAADRDYWRPTNPAFRVVVADFGYYSIEEQTRFLRFLDRLAPDVTHFALPQQPVLYRRPHVTTFHDLTLLRSWDEDKSGLAYRAKRALGGLVFRHGARSSAVVLAPTEFTKKEVVDFAGIDPGRVRVTYEAAEPATEPRSPSSSGAGTPYLLYVGQQSGYKNIRRLVLAHQQLVRERPGLRLVLVGKRSPQTTANERWVREQGFDAVEFAGFVPDAELARLYAEAACYVFPSLMEGFGLPGLEAMQAGAPVVSSAATCLPEVYGDAALYFDPQDVDDMAARIGQLLADEALRSELIARGRARAALFSWEAMARDTLAAYEACASPAAGRGSRSRARRAA